MRVLKRGAEAILYLENEKVLVKERVKKNYRLDEIDSFLRKFRTRREVKLLREARKIGVCTPTIFEVDEKNGIIKMEFVDGILLKSYLEKEEKEKIEEVCVKVGRAIGKMHSFNLIHGDPTTSNMILKNSKIYFIDFGLGFFSNRIEDKAVDLRLLHDSINATHPKILEICWRNIIKGYKAEFKNAKEVLDRFEEIKKRVRYAKR